MAKPRTRFGPTRRRKLRTCGKCRKKFRRRMFDPLHPNYCGRPGCQRWGEEQTKMRESIARLSAPDVTSLLYNFGFGFDPAALRQHSKSLAFGSLYGSMHTVQKIAAEIVESEIKMKLAEMYPQTAARVKMLMPVHEEITFEVEIDDPTNAGEPIELRCKTKCD